ncbi:hypothetical protein L2E82_33658 [Cichorium intybus]|uniref:Uncharacterized protein n=1 Tax=Cichorium intybus TaxID=13427 RepID=A0ACB9BKW0_CICIN|nr:hypothetical protein L2E82_33658 [Cichorium intybus]
MGVTFLPPFLPSAFIFLLSFCSFRRFFIKSKLHLLVLCTHFTSSTSIFHDLTGKSFRNACTVRLYV